MKKFKLKSLLILSFMVLIFLNGCMSYYKINVSSISGNTDIGKRINIYPANNSISKNDLLFKEFSSYIKKALVKKGYEIVDNIEDADQICFLSYGISDPQTEIVTVPQFGKTGIKSSKTTGDLDIYDNNIDIKTKTTYDYEYGITGYNNVAQTVYTRIIKISSYDFNLLKEQDELIQLWETEIISTGKSSDLRKIFPALIAASEDYIGEDTKETISLTISEEDDRIEEYRN